MTILPSVKRKLPRLRTDRRIHKRVHNDLLSLPRHIPQVLHLFLLLNHALPVCSLAAPSILLGADYRSLVLHPVCELFESGYVRIQKVFFLFRVLLLRVFGVVSDFDFSHLLSGWADGFVEVGIRDLFL